MLLLLILVLLLAGGGIFWFALQHNTGTTPGNNGVPNVAGFYNGTIINTTANITTSMTLTIQQNHERITGFSDRESLKRYDR